MRRLGALLGAVVMVAAAFFIRGATVEDGGASDDGETPAKGLVCPPELADVCGAATDLVVTETAGATTDRLLEARVEAELGGEAWIVPAAWARLVVAERNRLDLEPIFEVAEEPIASSPVVLAAWTDQADELGVRCERPVDWRCLADEHGRTVLRSRVRVGLPSIDSATGLVVAAAQAGALLGRSDFATNDFDPQFLQRADALAGGQDPSPLRTMRTRGPGQFTAVGVVAADARDVGTQFGTIAVFEDREPLVRADLVALVPAGAELDDGWRDTLRSALTGAGWNPPAGGPDGLPDGSVLAAVRTLWNESR
jgi:hypothetical protein